MIPCLDFSSIFGSYNTAYTWLWIFEKYLNKQRTKATKTVQNLVLLLRKTEYQVDRYLMYCNSIMKSMHYLFFKIWYVVYTSWIRDNFDLPSGSTLSQLGHCIEFFLINELQFLHQSLSIKARGSGCGVHPVLKIHWCSVLGSI